MRCARYRSRGRTPPRGVDLRTVYAVRTTIAQISRIKIIIKNVSAERRTKTFGSSNNFQACLAVSTTYSGMISVMAIHIGALVHQYRYKMENHVLVSSEFIVIEVISL